MAAHQGIREVRSSVRRAVPGWLPHRQATGRVLPAARRRLRPQATGRECALESRQTQASGALPVLPEGVQVNFTYLFRPQ
jgi:hypothetical protein